MNAIVCIAEEARILVFDHTYGRKPCTCIIKQRRKVRMQCQTKVRDTFHTNIRVMMLESKNYKTGSNTNYVKSERYTNIACSALWLWKYIFAINITLLNDLSVLLYHQRVWNFLRDERSMHISFPAYNKPTELIQPRPLSSVVFVNLFSNRIGSLSFCPIFLVSGFYCT